MSSNEMSADMFAVVAGLGKDPLFQKPYIAVRVDLVY